MEDVSSKQPECYPIHTKKLEPPPVHGDTTNGLAHEMVTPALAKSTEITDTSQPQLSREILIRSSTWGVDNAIASYQIPYVTMYDIRGGGGTQPVIIR
jgi:hypothetical protein